MAGTGRPSIVAAFVIACGLAALAPTAAMAQIPFPMIPNFNFGPQHYRGSSHYSTRSRSHQNEDKVPDKSKEKDATQPDSTASAPTPRQQQTSSAPRDTPPPAGSNTAPSPPPQKANDEQPAFQPSR